MRGRAMLALLALVAVLSLTACGGSDNGEETHSTLKDKARVECEEKAFATEESFDQPSVAFENDPYGYVEEYCDRQLGE